MTEDEVKKAVATCLEAQGFNVSVAWGHAPGVDIEARRDAEHWVIEAKGTGRYDQMGRNYFFAVIGSLLQRMSEEGTHYCLALPEVAPFINLVERFPQLARQRTQLSFLFVRREGTAYAVREIGPPGRGTP